MNEVNEVQIKMLKDIENGNCPLPANYQDYYESVKNILMAFDFEKEEAERLEKCREQFVKFSMQKGDDLGDAYLSGVGYLLSTRKYFKSLSVSMRSRGVDNPLREILRGMIKDGLLRLGTTGAKYSATIKGVQWIESKEQEEKELRREMRNIAIQDKLNNGESYEK